MARIRTVKPELFKHEDLHDLEVETGLPLRLAFIGLWTVCDREGRFPWRPRMIKAEVLPYDSTPFSDVLAALEKGGFVRSYEIDGKRYGHIPSWKDHQVINAREAQSKIPPPDGADHSPAPQCAPATDDMLEEGRAQEPEIESREEGAIDVSDDQPEPETPPVADESSDEPTDREIVLEAIGYNPRSPMTATGKLVGNSGDVLQLNKWKGDLGLSMDDILAVIHDVMVRRPPDEDPPTSFKYFTAEMSRYAGQKGEKLKAIEGGGGRLAASVVKKFPSPSMPDAWEGQG